MAHKLPNDVRLRILGNKETSRKSLKYLELMTSSQPVTHKGISDICARKSRKWSVKYFIEKPTLLNSWISLQSVLCGCTSIINIIVAFYLWGFFEKSKSLRLSTVSALKAAHIRADFVLLDAFPVTLSAVLLSIQSRAPCTGYELIFLK